MLKALDFEITFPTTYRFLERFNTVMEGSEQAFLLGCYLGELTLIQVKMNKWLPSRIAASCLYLARKMLAHPQPWTKDMQAVTGLTEKNVRESAMDIC